MPTLEELIDENDAGPQAQRFPNSPFLELARSDGVTPDEFSLVQGQDPTTAMKTIVDHRARVLRERGAAQNRRPPQITSINQLLELTRRFKGLPQAISVPLLRQLTGIAGPDRIDEFRQREAIRSQGRPPPEQPIPRDLISAIGTPEFGQRIQSADGLSRQVLSTLYNLDRQEREFQARSNRPGKVSNAMQKLREMQALGIPITMNTVLDIYAPGSPATQNETLRRRPERQRPASLGEIAGIDAGGDPESVVGGQEEAEPAPALNARQRFRANLESELP